MTTAPLIAPPLGVINLDKPPGLTSARAVAIVKRLLPKGTKIGHAGTLDPFATGVLLLLVGKATKACERMMDAPKQYDATVRFGATTATDDLDSPAEPWTPAGGGPLVPPTAEQVVAALPAFVGTILQRPPAFSALKVGGQRAYDLARGGNAVVFEPRPVKVYGVELLGYAWPDCRLRVDCGRGTYIRSIARDLGAALDVGGHLVALRRTAIGPFRAADAVTLEQLKADGVGPWLRGVPAPPQPAAADVTSPAPAPAPPASP
ncbi:MAG TPA: tRNA pseudouridine(55) synthase TruB [Humisphaera sp.]